MRGAPASREVPSTPPAHQERTLSFPYPQSGGAHTMYSRMQTDVAMIVHRERIEHAIARRIENGARRRRGVRIVIGRRPREGEHIVIAIARPS